MPPGLSDQTALEYGIVRPKSHPKAVVSSRLQDNLATTLSATQLHTTGSQGTTDKKRKIHEVIDLSTDDNSNKDKAFKASAKSGARHQRAGESAGPMLKDLKSQGRVQEKLLQHDYGNKLKSGRGLSRPHESSQGQESAQFPSSNPKKFAVDELHDFANRSESDVKLDRPTSKKRSTSSVQVIVPQYNPPRPMPPDYEAVRRWPASQLSDDAASSEDFGEAYQSRIADHTRRKSSFPSYGKRSKKGGKRLAMPREINDSDDELDELAASQSGLMAHSHEKMVVPSSRKTKPVKKHARLRQEGMTTAKCDVLAMFSNAKLLMRPGENWTLSQIQSTGTVQFYDGRTQAPVPEVTIQAQDVDRIQQIHELEKLIIHMKCGKGIKGYTRIFLELATAKEARTITDQLMQHNPGIEPCTAKIDFMEERFEKIFSRLTQPYFQKTIDTDDEDNAFSRHSTSMLSHRDKKSNRNNVNGQDINEDVSLTGIIHDQADEDAVQDDITTEELTSQRHVGFESMQTRHKEDQEVYNTSPDDKSSSLRPRRGGFNHNSFDNGAENAQRFSATPAAEHRGTRSQRAHKSSRYSSEDAPFDNLDDLIPMTPSGRSQLSQDWFQQWKKPLLFHGKNKARATVEKDDVERLNDGVFLNDNLIDFYLRFLEGRLEKENPGVSRRVYFLNSFFYKKLSAKGRRYIDYQAVERWTSKVDLVKYDYIFVPVHENSHWYLAIICNASKLLKDVSGSILVADSEQRPIPNTTSSSHQREVIEVPDSQDHDEDSRKLIKVISITDSQQLDQNSPSANNTFKAAVSMPSPASQKGLPRVDAVVSHIGLGQGSSPEYVATSPVDLSGKSNARTPRVFDPTQPRIITLDSLGNRHSPTCTRLRDYLVAEIRTKKGIEVAPPGSLGLTVANLPQQQNNYDCGIFLLSYAEAFLNGPDDFFRKAVKGEDLEINMRDPVETRVLIKDTILQLQKEQEQD